MGHVRNYTIGDVVARYKRMRGFNVLHPMGWDAFGLPAENAAMARGLHPAAWTYDNIAYMRRQLKELGYSYDWDRELATCDPNYYRWEQLIFIEMFRRGLAYKKEAPVNWCPKCQTVLANEQVEDGLCWRCDSPVHLKELNQWFFKITAYAEELLADLDQLTHWPERVLTMQRHWIGKSPGAEIYFPLAQGGEPLTVFTTRADTLFGATFMSLAPEHPLALIGPRNPGGSGASWNTGGPKPHRGVLEEMPRRRLHRPLLWNPSPATMPIYVANFVLMGTAPAVMAVPAHDQRDLSSPKYGLPIGWWSAPGINSGRKPPGPLRRHPDKSGDFPA
jgi:leucyl-tRNA synthetase